MKHKILFILVFSLFLLTNCEDVVDCVINRRPELTTNQPEEATEGRYYFDKISAEIKNEPADNSYEYYFSFRGDLPRGLDITYEYRDIIIEGVPEESGRYRFTIYLDVDPPYRYDSNGNYDDPLCTDHTSRSYVLVVK